MRTRTGYSFRKAVGHLGEVFGSLSQEQNFYSECKVAPISDTNSTFAFVKWDKLCKKHGWKPAFGVEIGVVESVNEKKPAIDHWTFFATESLAPLHRIVSLSTDQFRYEPLLTYEQALNTPSLIKITGHRTRLDLIPAGSDHLYIGLSPSLAKGQFKAAQAAGHEFIATNDNRFTAEGDKAFYEVLCGRDASTQSYPQWMMNDRELEMFLEEKFPPVAVRDAFINRNDILAEHSFAQLTPGKLLVPEKPQTLREMCLAGAQKLGCDLSRTVYAQRLDRELKLIEEKQFEDYFYIIADVVQWARQRMAVGPARGSSCGSLVCYLLEITTVDPIPYDLIFERFIDINRDDLPDIDIDFSDVNRQQVFDYMAEKYGARNVARLGTVSMYKPRSALNEAAVALDIPPWKVNPVLDSIIERSGGDSRALQAIEDTLNDTEAGRALLEEYPEIRIAQRMEGHPRHHSQHAAGIVLTERPVEEFVAIDSRTGATHCDKKDAEELELLKIDALGLTQLSIFEDTLKLAGEDLHLLEKISLDDQAAFDVLNRGEYSGIFQFNGLALQSVTDQVEIKHLEDIISITALARPGPLNTGGTNHWIKVKTGREPLTYPHPLFEPYLSNTLGVVAYQEQVMQIGREIGNLSWEDVTALRKAMSKSLGKEYFDQYGDRWKSSAIEKGIPADTVEKVWDDLCLSGETLLLNPHPSKGVHKYIKLKDLYKRGGLGPTNKANPQLSRKRQKLLMWDGNSLKPFENWGVKYSGRKVTHQLTTKSGNSIRATSEHKFMLPDGSWKKLVDLSVGDFVVSDSGPIPSKRKEPKKTNKGGHNWWHKLKAGEPSLAEGKRWLKSNFKKCEVCKSAPYEETHHINMDHEDHRIENLLAVCRKCHKKLHATFEGYPKAWQSGRGVFADEITSISVYGEEDVYDIHMPDPHNNFLADGIVVHNCAYGSWAFNRSHAVAYGIVSYQCCWLKAHYPLEFAAATLTHSKTPEAQIKVLRELYAEGYEYIPADLELSSDKWQVGEREGKKLLVGPLSNVIGIGPKLEEQILEAKRSGSEIPNRAKKLLENPVTKIDSLWPISDRFKQLMPDPKERNIFTPPLPIADCQVNGEEYPVLVFCTVASIKPKDENEEIDVAKRGYRFKGPTQSLNLRLEDDTDVVFAKIDRFAYEKVGKPIVERGRAGKALYAVKGTVPKDFRMIKVKMVRYIGDLEKDEKPEAE